MRGRLFVNADYPTVREWWVQRQVEPVPLSHLPIGFVVEDEAGPVVAVWAYRDFSTGWAMLTWFLSRPGVAARSVDAAFSELMRFAEHFLKEKTPIINAMTHRRGLKRWLMRHGYLFSSDNLSGFIKRA